jgi:hypothetical protein
MKKKMKSTKKKGTFRKGGSTPKVQKFYETKIINIHITEIK